MHSASDTLFDIEISIDTESQLQFKEALELTSSDPAIESVSLSGNGKLTCLLKVRAANEQEASDKSLLFANRVADILTYEYRAKTKSVAVLRCSYKDGNNVTVNVQGHQIDAFLNMVAIPDDGTVLSELISRQLPSRGYELLSMYRQARNEESVLARYLLLYRLLEYEFHGWVGVDEWIIKQKPNTTQIQDRNGKKTIYTDLRDKIHPGSKQIQFPYADASSRVDELETLVREVLNEMCH